MKITDEDVLLTLSFLLIVELGVFKLADYWNLDKVGTIIVTGLLVYLMMGFYYHFQRPHFQQRLRKNKNRNG